MKNLLVHTKHRDTFHNLHYRFLDFYTRNDNYDRLTIVGIPDEVNKTLSVGISFCSYPDNFSREEGVSVATRRAAGITKMSDYSKCKPYAVLTIEDFTMENCLAELYAIHDDLVTRSVRGVKQLLNKQIVK